MRSMRMQKDNVRQRNFDGCDARDIRCEVASAKLFFPNGYIESFGAREMGPLARRVCR